MEKLISEMYESCPSERLSQISSFMGKSRSALQRRPRLIVKGVQTGLRLWGTASVWWTSSGVDVVPSFILMKINYCLIILIFRLSTCRIAGKDLS